MGSAWMLVAGLCFALMSVIVKVAGQWFSGVELVFYRSLFGLLLILGGLMLRHGAGGARHLFGDHTRLHIRRGVVGFGALATFFHTLTVLPVSLAVTLNYTSPLFLALLMPWQLKEQPSGPQYRAVLLGFVGVLLLLRPWQSAAPDLMAGLVGLLSGVMAAFAYIHVRRLGRAHEPEWRTVFWFAAVCVVGAAGMTSVSGWHGLEWRHAGWLLALGLLATLGQLAMTRAYRKGKTVVVAGFAFSTVLFSGALDRLVLRQELPLVATLGIVLIVVAGIRAAQLSFGERT
jgi:drug/metabolite transporter (DMT)-like permease